MICQGRMVGQEMMTLGYDAVAHILSHVVQVVLKWGFLSQSNLKKSHLHFKFETQPSLSLFYHHSSSFILLVTVWVCAWWLLINYPPPATSLLFHYSIIEYHLPCSLAFQIQINLLLWSLIKYPSKPEPPPTHNKTKTKGEANKKIPKFEGVGPSHSFFVLHMFQRVTRFRGNLWNPSCLYETRPKPKFLEFNMHFLSLFFLPSFLPPFCSVDSDFEKQGADICKLIWKHACMVDSESVSPFYYYFFFLWQWTFT